MPDHYRIECWCGVVIEQCACRCPDKRVEVHDNACPACQQMLRQREVLVDTLTASLAPARSVQYTPDHNRYLAEMGYTAYARSRTRDQQRSVPSFDELPEAEHRAWISAAAAIRRRVVTWRMPAEQEA